MSGSVADLVAADASLSLPLPVPLGNQAELVAGAIAGLRASDWWVPSLRTRAGAVLRGLPVDRVAGLEGAKPYKVAPVFESSAVRALAAVGLGVGEHAALVHLGQGSLSDGGLHEALNLALLRESHVIFLVATMNLEGAPVGKQFAADPAAWGKALGVAVKSVDGSSASAVEQAVKQAVNKRGPTLILAAVG